MLRMLGITISLLLTGCASKPPIEVYLHNEIQSIPETEQILVDPVPLPEKPHAYVLVGTPSGETEEGKYVAFTFEGAKTLLEMRDGAQINIEYINQLNHLNAAVVAERNKLLDIAKDEEVRANKLRIELEQKEQQRQQEKFESQVEIITWKVLTVIIGLAAL